MALNRAEWNKKIYVANPINWDTGVVVVVVVDPYALDVNVSLSASMVYLSVMTCYY